MGIREQLPISDAERFKEMQEYGAQINKIITKGIRQLSDKDGDTRVTVEQNTDEDKVRIYTNGTEIAIVDSNLFEIKKQLKISGASRVSAYRNTTQTIPHNTHTTIIFNNVSYDNLNEYNATNGRFTASKAGYYFITARALTATVAWTSGNVYVIEVFKNGINTWVGSRHTVEYGITRYIDSIVSCCLQLNENDYIEIKAYHSRGSNTDLDPESAYVCFYIQRIS
jgi:hypothetical protein